MKKLMIQSTLGGGKAYIFLLPKGEKFMQFFEAKDIKLNFPMGWKVKAGLCSKIFYLSNDKGKIKMNALFVDIYRNPVQFCLMKSSLDLSIPEECLKGDMKNVFIFNHN